jgi:hypothetical protein
MATFRELFRIKSKKMFNMEPKSKCRIRLGQFCSQEYVVKAGNSCTDVHKAVPGNGSSFHMDHFDCNKSYIAGRLVQERSHQNWAALE